MGLSAVDGSTFFPIGNAYVAKINLVTTDNKVDGSEFATLEKYPEQKDLVADLLIYTLSLPVPQLADLCPGPGSLPAHKRSGTFPAESAAPLGCTACACDQTDCADAGPAILEANYHTPCLANHPHYISGRLWHRAQAITGYPLMTGLTVQHEPQL